jgi:hypothetical protein
LPACAGAASRRDRSRAARDRGANHRDNAHRAVGADMQARRARATKSRSGAAAVKIK